MGSAVTLYNLCASLTYYGINSLKIRNGLPVFSVAVPCTMHGFEAFIQVR
jgi:hypothetical protein